jgi:hypothetical protein
VVSRVAVLAEKELKERLEREAKLEGKPEFASHFHLPSRHFQIGAPSEMHSILTPEVRVATQIAFITVRSVPFAGVSRCHHRRPTSQRWIAR